MRIAWVGFHEEGLKSFNKILQDGHNVVTFITLSDESMAKRSAGSRDYEVLCKKADIPFFMVDTIKGETAYKLLCDCKPDLVVVLGWSEILPDRLLDIPTIGTVGTHAALLPHNKGSAPVNWALIHGEEETGNTLMWLNKEVDAGEIIDQIAFSITPYDTCQTLYDKVADTNMIMIDRLVCKLENGEKIESIRENYSEEPLLPRRRPKDGLIDWHTDGMTVYNFIRALTDPYPGAFSFLNGQKWIFWKAAYLPIVINNEEGEIISEVYGFSDNSCGLLINTKNGVLFVTEIEDEKGFRYTGAELIALKLKGIFGNEESIGGSSPS